MAETTQVDVKKLSFERAIEELESIVKRLEDGKVPLEESVAIYERLYALYRSAYFALGTPDAAPAALGSILPDLKRIAAEVASSS